MILECKFQILGIKTTVGHYIIIFSRNSCCLFRKISSVMLKDAIGTVSKPTSTLTFKNTLIFMVNIVHTYCLAPPQKEWWHTHTYIYIERCRYNAVNFLKKYQQKTSHSSPDILPQFLQLLIQHLTILHRVIMALDIIWYMLKFHLCM